MTVDVEDWYHILDSPKAPSIEKWGFLRSRIEQNVQLLLQMFKRTGARATFFWLAWLAERHENLVLRCIEEGHEIASHGYGHILAYQAGREAFFKDISRAKDILESITGAAVLGFRAPGFGITGSSKWALDAIREAGYAYDSSIFPAERGHGGMPDSELGPYLIQTRAGQLLEFPMSAIQLFGKRFCLFGGGYLRLAPVPIIRWACREVHTNGQPLVVYVHPREIDPDHPRLPLSLWRKFKSYVNIRSTMPKLEWLCRNYRFVAMGDLAHEYYLTL
jgi:polysaccharide deacetylase family protein (PEP-CTERM system associated)